MFTALDGGIVGGEGLGCREVWHLEDGEAEGAFGAKNRSVCKDGASFEVTAYVGCVLSHEGALAVAHIGGEGGTRRDQLEEEVLVGHVGFPGCDLFDSKGAV